jgi:hypothetical protein
VRRFRNLGNPSGGGLGKPLGRGEEALIILPSLHLSPHSFLAEREWLALRCTQHYLSQHSESAAVGLGLIQRFHDSTIQRLSLIVRMLTDCRPKVFPKPGPR